MVDYRENAKWTVYVHIVPKEISGYDWDKYYVGITSKTVNQRWKHGSGYKKYQVIYNVFQKYGWDNVLHEIIASNLTESEAKDMEKTLIFYLKSNTKEYGYNRTSGGDGHSGDVNTIRQNYVGCTFGELTVLYDLPDKEFPSGQYGRMEMCKCSCGKEIPVLLRNILGGNTTSCGHIGKPNKREYNKYDLSGEYGIGWTSNTNEEFYFDLEDYDKIKNYCWRINLQNSKLVAGIYKQKRETTDLIRHIFNFSKNGKPIKVKHVNGNKYDFRKNNIVFLPPKNLNTLDYIELLKCDS